MLKCVVTAVKAVAVFLRADYDRTIDALEGEE